MRQAILECVDLVAKNTSHVGRILVALAMASAIAAGNPVTASGQDTSTRAIVVQTASPGKITFSSEFLAFVQQLENAGRVGWNNAENKWYSHPSPEGGRETIAYGHKIQDDAEEQRFASGITEQQALDLLCTDLDIAWDKAASYVKSRHGVELSDLSQKQQEMLTEYAFNLGTLRGFPKFVKAVVEEDWDTARLEYKRTYRDTNGNRHELSRNNDFYNRYLKL